LEFAEPLEFAEALEEEAVLEIRLAVPGSGPFPQLFITQVTTITQIIVPILKLLLLLSQLALLAVLVQREFQTPVVGRKSRKSFSGRHVGGIVTREVVADGRWEVF
jgi:hypothetical protein